MWPPNSDPSHPQQPSTAVHYILEQISDKLNVLSHKIRKSARLLNVRMHDVQFYHMQDEKKVNGFFYCKESKIRRKGIVFK